MNFDLNNFLQSHTEIRYNPSYEVVTINGIAYIPCEVKTTSSYYVVQEDGSITYKLYDKLAADKYISPYNRGIIGKLDAEGSSYSDCEIENADYLEIGYGNAAVIVDTETATIIRVYYFKDTYNLPSSIRFYHHNDEFLLFDFAEHSYILYTATHEVLVFDTGTVQAFDHYVLLLPYDGYDLIVRSYKLFNSRSRVTIDITSQIKTVMNCWDVTETDLKLSCDGYSDNTFVLRVSTNDATITIKIDDPSNAQAKNIASADAVREVRKQLKIVSDTERKILGKRKE